MLHRILLFFFAAAAASPAETAFVHDARQLTFSGKRSGEGYFSGDGKSMIFQSEREPTNPFYQIYHLDFESGDIRRLSPGTGKTTCAWLHPDGKQFMFASTHADPAALAKQEAELKDRAEGKQKRYQWDYDPGYEIYSGRLDAQSGFTNLTRTAGYDAEGSFSPDGQWVAFASNRHADAEASTDADKAKQQLQPSWMMDIYTMRADGSEVKRLTNVRGYDGGPFYSADGLRICWRRFNEEETTAEIWSMNADGSGQQALTRMGAMSWAPYFHPSGQYLIFTTNKHGFDNFELYIVDADGKHDPVRVTDSPGFDGLPVFDPSGQRMAWTSNRTPEKASQIFIGQWDHGAALTALGLSAEPAAQTLAHAAAGPQPSEFSDAITAGDLRRHVEYLASDALMGRATGSAGEALAVDYIMRHLSAAGLQAAGTMGWQHPFTFTAGVELGSANKLTLTMPDSAAVVSRDWLPLSFSTTGAVPESGVVFAGYGIEMEEAQGENGKKLEGYSSYFHLDVKDKWVMCLRYVPEGLSQEERVRFGRHSTLRNKVLTARQKGARGLIIVSGPTSKVREQLVPMNYDASMATSGLPAISITDALAAKLLGKDLAALQAELDKGAPVPGFSLPGVNIAGSIDIVQEKKTGHNVLGRLRAPGNSTEPAIIITAHLDHLGMAASGRDSLSTSDKPAIHHGADDNASGVAGMLEIAQSLAAAVRSGKLQLKRDVLFAGWSGEESGLLGSSAWCRDAASATGDESASLTAKLAANLNMDMIGRMKKSLILQGLGSSDWWTAEIEKRNAVTGLNLILQQDCYLPTDAAVFYLRRVPIFNAFTGQHEDYHKPSDTADKLNYEGAAQVSTFMMLVARSLATTDEEPAYREMKKPDETARGGMRVYLGTVPDYAQEGIEGVKLSGVAPIGPAAKAGLLPGDIIVKLAGKDIKNIYDYTFVMGALKVGVQATIEVMRKTERLTMEITPGSRE